MLLLTPVGCQVPVVIAWSSSRDVSTLQNEVVDESYWGGACGVIEGACACPIHRRQRVMQIGKSVILLQIVIRQRARLAMQRPKGEIVVGKETRFIVVPVV